jgi:hypothetical protein
MFSTEVKKLDCVFKIPDVKKAVQPEVLVEKRQFSLLSIFPPLPDKFYKKRHEMYERMDRYENMQFDSEEDKFKEEHVIFSLIDECDSLGSRRTYMWPSPWDEVRSKFSKIVGSRSSKKFQESIIKYSKEDVRNGYHLYDIDTFNYYSENLIYEWGEKWNKAVENNLDIDTEFSAFWDRFDSEACSDWSKQDDKGSCFGGYWDAEEGSYDKENAYTLSRRYSALKLFCLPFPKELIFETITMGCNNRMESVRYSNQLMCFFMDKAKAMDVPLAHYQARNISLDIRKDRYFQ